LDPPFLTGREHFRVERSRATSGEIARNERPAFDDRWDSLGDYLSALESRIRLLRDLLAPHGSMVLHVDPKTSHYLKVMCDEIFGLESFASEVIWRYRRWPAKTKNFQRVHDVMLRYVKDPTSTPRFNQLYEPLAASTQKTWGDRKQRAITNDDGHRLRSSKTEEKSKGTPLGDVWDIGIVAPVAKERTGYPTQKPEALLQRWIDACTDEGDLVLDPYMGSGTTLTVACKSGRRAIGIDMGAEAHEVTRARLSAAQISYCSRRAEAPLARASARPSRAGIQSASSSRDQMLSTRSG
jgi:site-specific DNA-methyltransferase (adenine-specific)